VPADSCPVCQRPRLANDRTVYSAELHCPRVDTSIRGPVGQLEADNACLGLGIEARDRQLDAGVRALKTLDHLLARAREVLVATVAQRAEDQVREEAHVRREPHTRRRRLGKRRPRLPRSAYAKG
jgi:hypothetical protein